MRYPGIRDRRKWRPKEEMGGNGRAREGERERENEKCCFCLQNDLKEPKKSKKCIYIASQKPWFTAFIAIIKKVEHTLLEQIILNEVRIGGSPPIKVTPLLRTFQSKS